MSLLCDGNIPTLPLLTSQSSQNITIKPWFMKLDALHSHQGILEVSSSQVSDIYQTSVAITVVSKTSTTSDLLKSVTLEVSTRRNTYHKNVCFQCTLPKIIRLLLEKAFLTYIWELFQWKPSTQALPQYIFSFHSNPSHTKAYLCSVFLQISFPIALFLLQWRN